MNKSDGNSLNVLTGVIHYLDFFFSPIALAFGRRQVWWWIMFEVVDPSKVREGYRLAAMPFMDKHQSDIPIHIYITTLATREDSCSTA